MPTNPPSQSVIVGTPHDDTITSSGHETIQALGGNDTIIARGGDRVFAGSGNDQVHVEPQFGPFGALPDPVTVFAGPGDDVITKSFLGPNISAHLTAYGGPGNDSIQGANVGYGGPGDDFFTMDVSGTYTGGPGADTFFAPQATAPFASGGTITDFGHEDKIVFGSVTVASIAITETDGSTLLRSGTESVSLVGHFDPSRFVLTQSGADVVVTLAEPADDRATSAGASGIVAQGPNHPEISDPFLLLSAADQYLVDRFDFHSFASESPLTLGTNGNDTLFGDSGNNVVFGRGGDDIIATDLEVRDDPGGQFGPLAKEPINGGTDVIFAGAGDDRIFAGPRDFVDAGRGNDTVVGGAVMIGGAGDDQLIANGGGQTVWGGRGDDVISLHGNRVGSGIPPSLPPTTIIIDHNGADGSSNGFDQIRGLLTDDDLRFFDHHGAPFSEHHDLDDLKRSFGASQTNSLEDLDHQVTVTGFADDFTLKFKDGNGGIHVTGAGLPEEPAAPHDAVHSVADLAQFYHLDFFHV